MKFFPGVDFYVLKPEINEKKTVQNLPKNAKNNSLKPKNY